METLEHLKLDDLVPDPNQPRKDFNPEMLDELANSIAAVGVIQPICVRRNPSAALGQPEYGFLCPSPRKGSFQTLCRLIGSRFN